MLIKSLVNGIVVPLTTVIGSLLQPDRSKGSKKIITVPLTTVIGSLLQPYRHRCHFVRQFLRFL
jgi:hypothetical protein